MKLKKFEFKLCSNGLNYLYFNNTLYITEKGDYVILEEKDNISNCLNSLYCEKEKYKTLFKELQRQLKDVDTIYDLDHKDFNDLLELCKGNYFENTDKHIGWKRLDVSDK